MVFGLTSRSFSALFPWAQEMLFHFKLYLAVCASTWRKKGEGLPRGPVFSYRVYFCPAT